MTRLVPVNCKTCSGSGRVESENPYARLSDGTAWVIRKCPECDGRGSFEIEMDEADADMEAEHGARASRRNQLFRDLNGASADFKNAMLELFDDGRLEYDAETKEVYSIE